MLRKLVCVLLVASASGFVSPSAESCRRSQHVLGMSSDGPFELSVSLPGPGRNEMFGEEKKMHSVKLSMKVRELRPKGLTPSLLWAPPASHSADEVSGSSRRAFGNRRG